MHVLRETITVLAALVATTTAAILPGAHHRRPCRPVGSPALRSGEPLCAWSSSSSSSTSSTTQTNGLAVLAEPNDAVHGPGPFTRDIKLTMTTEETVVVETETAPVSVATMPGIAMISETMLLPTSTPTTLETVFRPDWYVDGTMAVTKTSTWVEVYTPMPTTLESDRFGGFPGTPGTSGTPDTTGLGKGLDN